MQTSIADRRLRCVEEAVFNPDGPGVQRHESVEHSWCGMGAYLSTPVTDKEVEEGEGPNLQYGVAAMQGWRRTMEDGADSS